MKKTIKKYYKSSFSEATESFSKFKSFDKPENEELKKDYYGHYLNILKIHIFLNMQINQYFLKKCQPLHLDYINIRLFLLNILQSSNEFFKESSKTLNIIRTLDVKCEIKGEVIDFRSDYHTLEHIFLILFFSLISKNLLDHVEMIAEYKNETDNKKCISFTIEFFKEKGLISQKKNSPNEVALYLTDKIFELHNLPENTLFEKIIENTKKYKIYELCLNLILFNFKKLRCIDFQIQDLSSEKQFITSVSFILPFKNCQKKLEHNFDAYETNFLKFNSFRFVQKQTNSSNLHFFLENITKAKNSNENSFEHSTEILKSEYIRITDNLNPCFNKKGRRLSEEIINNEDRNITSEENLTNDREANFKKKNNRTSESKNKAKKNKHCSKVMEIEWQMKNENLEEEEKVENKDISFNNNKVLLLYFC